MSRRFSAVLLTLTCAALFATAAAADELRIGGTGGALPVMHLLGEAFTRTHPNATITIMPSLGSGGGIKAALDGAISLAVSSRPLNANEVAKGAVAYEYGRAPFVFATHIETKVKGITLAQLAKIYSGAMRKWPDGTSINLVLRLAGDSDSEQVKSMSPQVREANVAAEKQPGMLFAITDQQSAEYIAKLMGSLGTTTLPQIIAEKRAVRVLELDGVEPTAANVERGVYPQFKDMLIVLTPKSPPIAHRFLEFVQSAAGQQILRETQHALLRPNVKS